jgi:hypothetical protein
MPRSDKNKFGINRLDNATYPAIPTGMGMQYVNIFFFYQI